MTPRSPKAGAALDRLEACEAQEVLRRLLAAHPDVRAEAEQMARALLGGVVFESVADEVEQSLRAVDLDDLGSRAGRHRDGYTSPGEAAHELLQEALDPVLASMTRNLDLGLHADALETCKGLVLGLYRIRDVQDDDVIAWAPDFAVDVAADAVRVLTSRENATRRRKATASKLRLDDDFLQKHVSEWAEFLTRTFEES